MNQTLNNVHDPMTVGTDSEFALNLWTLIQKHKPTRIIETGTWMATGTTAIIASALDDLIAEKHLLAEDITFITIESNTEAVKVARDNLKKSGFDLFTTVYHGLSIPRSLLPTPAEIKEWVIDDIKDLPIEAHHHESDRVYKYYAETANTDCEDDMLAKALRRFDGYADLVLLDSGGSIGFQEFAYLTERLEGDCFICCDDAFHVKHYKSLQVMLADPRFDVRMISREKYGFCIAQFRP